tara:strand:- start:1210 stop:1662 length:453 start_codon:yes stop_codon:yes gene_type:complete
MNWNVYKVFKNGKRAKAPVVSFKHTGEREEVDQYFNANIKKNFNEKNRGLEFLVLREDECQERAEEKTNKQEETALKNQARVLASLLKGANVKSKHRVVGGLIFAAATNWKWQWCALEGASNNYIEGLSPRFDNPRSAHQWMNQEIQTLT